MAIPNASVLANPEFMKQMMDAALDNPVHLTIGDLLPRPPRFRRNREVHAQRARKLRRRGEYVHFLRWENGHCVYCWGGPTPETFTFRMHPASQSDRGAE